MAEKVLEKVSCVECGKPIAANQAAKRKGLCLRCSAARNPLFVLYNSLIERIHHSPGGFDALSDAEKRYYAVTLFRNEVNNGGFDQFFSNSSGSYYDLIEKCLVAFDEPEVLELLNQAKQIVFSERDVPRDLEVRRKLLPEPTPELMSKLDELDQRFYRTPDTLSSKLEAFVREQGLITAE